MMFLNIPIDKLCVSPQTPLREAIATIQRGLKQIALVVDEERHLLGTITDGDVRRAILHDTPMVTPASDVMQRSFTAAQCGMSQLEIFDLMRTKSLRHIPLVDDQGVLVDLAWITDLIEQDELGIPAVVMAGGFGQRLRPLTEDLPKPLLPVGDRSLVEIIIQQLREAGIRRVHVATHYQGDRIAQHLGDGRTFGIEISYLTEDHPLGTAGALSLLEPSEQPLLVINGDILTGLDFRAMIAFHKEHQAVMTVAVKEYRVRVPYGVLETSDACVVGLSEKPTLRFLINAGVYLLSPEAQRCVPNGRPYDMTDLIERLIADGRRRVVSFPVQEYWLDIGRIEDYEQAQQDVKAGVV